MFKEQLHTSFDTITPSPELLDRISAMMSEEVAKKKKKKPIYMTVAAYGGAAAAVVITATAVIASTNGANSVRRSETNYAGAAVTAAGDSDLSGEADSVAIGDAAADDAAFSESFDISTTAAAEAATPATNAPEAADNASGAGAVAAGAAKSGADTESRAMFVEGESYSDDAGDINMMSVAAAAPEMAGSADAPMAEEESFMMLAPEAVAEADSANDMSIYSEDSPENDVNPGMGYIGTIPMYDITVFSFSRLPDRLVDLVITEDDLAGNRTRLSEYFDKYSADAAQCTSIEETTNLYTFIKFMGISDADAREILMDDPDIELTQEQVDILLTGDVETVTAAFATEYAIVKGDRVYSPYWLCTHTADEWSSAGITKEDIAQKYDLLTQMPFVEDDSVSRSDFLAALDKYLERF